MSDGKTLMLWRWSDGSDVLQITYNGYGRFLEIARFVNNAAHSVNS